MGSNKNKIRLLPEDEQIKIIMQIFTSRERVPDSCRRFGISTGTYYQMKNRLIEDGNQLKRVRKRAVNYLFQ